MILSIQFSVRSGKVAGEKHWLDRGKAAFGEQFMEEVKAVWNVAFMMLPLPIFWALFDQQGSRWTFQATRMNGDIFGYQMLPDQMQVINPLLILAFIPLFDYVVYPVFGETMLGYQKSKRNMKPLVLKLQRNSIC